MTRTRLMYALIIALGRPVKDAAEWVELGIAAGYSGYRDLAGFFGGRRPSMVRLPDGQRVLTPDGWDRARR